ncbi:MAG TPA: endonuclease/exonuclease/phosphatase family protein, partial [Pirellulales bacterium]
MAAFLLWNVNQKPLDGLVQSLVRELQIDIVLLVEYPFGKSRLPGLLLRDGLFKRPSSKRFAVFVRNGHDLSRLRYHLGKRVGFWSWTPPSGQEGLVVLLHGLDRRNYDDSTRRVFFRRVADAVQRRERHKDSRRTIVTGDFNAQPFDPAIVDSDGLHAIGVRAVGKRN